LLFGGCVGGQAAATSHWIDPRECVALGLLWPRLVDLQRVRVVSPAILVVYANMIFFLFCRAEPGSGRKLAISRCGIAALDGATMPRVHRSFRYSPCAVRFRVSVSTKYSARHVSPVGMKQICACRQGYVRAAHTCRDADHEIERGRHGTISKDRPLGGMVQHRARLSQQMPSSYATMVRLEKKKILVGVNDMTQEKTTRHVQIDETWPQASRGATQLAGSIQ